LANWLLHVQVVFWPHAFRLQRQKTRQSLHDKVGQELSAQRLGSVPEQAFG
jgi:hypothetical protein